MPRPFAEVNHGVGDMERNSFNDDEFNGGLGPLDWDDFDGDNHDNHDNLDRVDFRDWRYTFATSCCGAPSGADA